MARKRASRKNKPAEIVAIYGKAFSTTEERVMSVEGRDLSQRLTQEATKDMGIDDKSSHPAVVFRRCRRRYMPSSLGVRLFREPDVGNPPVRFDEREQEPELCQTDCGDDAKAQSTATGRLSPLRLLDSTEVSSSFDSVRIGSIGRRV